MPEPFPNTKPFISTWSSNPIPSLSLSAAGLLALADLHTVAQRTVITGGSSWLDAFVLAPGLHYQQAVEALSQEPGPSMTAVLQKYSPGQEARFEITNPAMVQYLRRQWQQASKNGVLTLNIDVTKKDTAPRQSNHLSSLLRRRAIKNTPSIRSASASGQSIQIEWVSQVLYLSSPALTIIAAVFMCLLCDWWGLGFIVALMISRILNIWSIKQRSRHVKKPATELLAQLTTTSTDQLSEYSINLGNGSSALLHGLDSDIVAVTTQTWLREQSASESYLEAMAKVLVYIVAAFSGNQTQAGAMVLLALLLLSAGLLGLSNAHVRGFRTNGRIARLQSTAEVREGPGDVKRGMANRQRPKDLEKNSTHGAAPMEML